MKYARVVGGSAVEIFVPFDGFSLTDCFHADMAAQFVSVPDSVVVGSKLSNGQWSAPPAAQPPGTPQPVYHQMDALTFYLAFTPQERIAIKASTNSIVMEFWNTYERAERLGRQIDPNLASVQQALGYLALVTNATPTPGAGILAPARVSQILAGIPQ